MNNIDAKLPKLFFLVFILVVASSCRNDDGNLNVLSMTDSAFVQGYYEEGERLLSADELLVKEEKGRAVQSYCRLLEMEKLYFMGGLNSSCVDVLDSLCRYYAQSGENEKYARALLFLGEFFIKNDDYPSAIEHLLKAEEAAVEANDTRLRYLIVKAKGDLYLTQRLYDEAIPCCRYYYAMASAHHDTLRMAYGARYMGKVCTIEQKIDSIIFYYKHAADLARTLPQGDRIVAHVMDDLADVYIQIEQWDSAAAIMQRDTISDLNWAYWHYGQEHTDSAIYYFEKTLGRYKWAGEVEALTILAQLERRRGHADAAMDYYDRLAAAEDSLREQQKAEATLRMNAQYNYASITRQRDALEQRNKDMAQLLWMTVGAAVAVIAIGALLWRSYRQRKEQEATQLRLAQKEMENSFELSRQQLKENKAQQEMLLQQLAEARQQNNQQLAERLQMETDALDSQRRSIEAQQQLREQRRKDFVASALYERLKSPDTDGNRHLSEAEWQQLKDALDGIYNLTPRLLSLARFSEIELRVCCLLKLQVPPADIAFLISRSKSAVSLARKRMYYKATGRSGKAEDFDLFIAGM